MKLLFWSEISKLLFLLEIQRTISKLIEMDYVNFDSFIHSYFVFLMHYKGSLPVTYFIKTIIVMPQ